MMHRLASTRMGASVMRVIESLPFGGKSRERLLSRMLLALGFRAQTPDRMLGKISSALSPDGVFCGSESMCREGQDHLQFFHTVDDLRRLLQPFFRYVHVKQIEYLSGGRSRYLRREAYWRCAHYLERLEMAAWFPRGRESA